jgi:tRNA (guanine-N7-)-methyltransferase
MGQNKLQRFAELKALPNALEYPQNMKGKWLAFFKNDYPLTLELACGKGEYATGLASLYKNRNFIGVDIKGNRMWVGAKKAIAEGFNNVAFLRTQIEKLDHYFDEGEVTEIWITFPDPQLKKAKKRLTHPRFLKLYQNVTGKGGVVNLKTDSPELYSFSKLVINYYGLELLADNNDVYAGTPNRELAIKTHYEQLDIARSNRVHYLKFALNHDFTVEQNEQFKRLLIEETDG